MGTRANDKVRLLLSPREAVKALSICERTLYSLTKARAIPCIRLRRCVRYSLRDLEQWIAENSEKSC